MVPTHYQISIEVEPLLNPIRVFSCLSLCALRAVTYMRAARKQRFPEFLRCRVERADLSYHSYCSKSASRMRMFGDLARVSAGIPVSVCWSGSTDCREGMLGPCFLTPSLKTHSARCYRRQLKRNCLLTRFQTRNLLGNPAPLVCEHSEDSRATWLMDIYFSATS